MTHVTTPCAPPPPVLQDPIFKGNKVPNPEMGYPGGIFDPLGFSKGNLKELQTKEIKNGRIAMVAYMGFVIQVSCEREQGAQQITDWSTQMTLHAAQWNIGTG